MGRKVWALVCMYIRVVLRTECWPDESEELVHAQLVYIYSDSCEKTWQILRWSLTWVMFLRVLAFLRTLRLTLDMIQGFNDLSIIYLCYDHFRRHNY